MARVSAEQWHERVKAWVASGKTAAEFASARGLDPRQLTWWKWKLSRQARPSRAAFVPVHVMSEASANPRAGIDVTFANGVLVRVPAGFSSRALAELIEVVGALAC